MIRAALLLLLAGCTTAPISDTPIPPADLAHCEALAGRHSILPGVAVHGAIGAAAGTLATSAVRGAATSSTISLGANTARSIGGFSIGNLVLPFAALGAIYGGLQGQERRAAIVRECLRDLGHRVY